MSNTQQVQYWKAFDNGRQKYINKLEKSVKSIFEKERKQLKSAYSNIDDVNKMYGVSEKIIKANVPNWINAFTAVYLVTIQDFGNQVYSDLHKKKAINSYNVYDKAIMDYIATTVGERVVEIDNTTLDKVKATILEGMEQGFGIEAIANMIDTLYIDQFILNRSQMIAQTEVVGASNYGSYSGALQSGAEVLKMWIPTFDQRTRDTHIRMGSHKHIPMTEKFSVGNSKMLYPGDPSGEAKEVIRCRCAIGYKRIESE